MIDEQLFLEMLDTYKTNVLLFMEQNTGFLVERVVPLTMEMVEKVLDYDCLVDKKFIHQHFLNFTVNAQITHEEKGYTTRIELSPDISWEARKGGCV